MKIKLREAHSQTHAHTPTHLHTQAHTNLQTTAIFTWNIQRTKTLYSFREKSGPLSKTENLHKHEQNKFTKKKTS